MITITVKNETITMDSDVCSAIIKSYPGRFVYKDSRYGNSYKRLETHFNKIEYLFDILSVYRHLTYEQYKNLKHGKRKV